MLTICSCDSAPTYSSTNMRYDCPLCNQSSYYWCSDCGQDKLIWCKTMGNVNSLICQNCSYVAYPYYTKCANCSKDCRSDAKFWFSKNNINHPECGF